MAVHRKCSKGHGMVPPKQHALGAASSNMQLDGVQPERKWLSTADIATSHLLPLLACTSTKAAAALQASSQLGPTTGLPAASASRVFRLLVTPPGTANRCVKLLTSWSTATLPPSLRMTSSDRLRTVLSTELENSTTTWLPSLLRLPRGLSAAAPTD